MNKICFIVGMIIFLVIILFIAVIFREIGLGFVLILGMIAGGFIGGMIAAIIKCIMLLGKGPSIQPPPEYIINELVEKRIKDSIEYYRNKKTDLDKAIEQNKAASENYDELLAEFL